MAWLSSVGTAALLTIWRCLLRLHLQLCHRILFLRWKPSLANQNIWYNFDFPEITRTAGTERVINHSTVHFIKVTPGPPVHCMPKRLLPELLRTAKQEFSEIFKHGTARQSESPWSSPLHLAPKKNHGWCLYSDYCLLNSRAILDRYPLRHNQDFTHSISGWTIFSKIQLIVKANNQILVNPNYIPKTAITTPFGMYEYPYM